MSGIEPINKDKNFTKPRLNSAFKALMSVHWWMAACYLMLFVTGPLMAQLSREVSFRSSLYDFHKSIGVLTMALLTWRILVLLRVWWRKYTKRIPKLTSEWWKTFGLHTSLYIFMWGVPVSGFFFSNSYQSNNIKFFGLILPDLFPQNSARVDLGRSVHFWLSYTFLVFILLHSLTYWKVIRANWRRLTNFVNKKFVK
ncbi:MAG: cytochrome b [Cyanomargarita calcarea GSE-NOS-MK-12-04C]|jgi:cytochrome b561|uniref:Cytochrome b n=1 Tax=Cyanomargarita calcarea GSE-NOS-MK-12-04C TaxID=2839659 RepID=A0A951QRJ7_9CYAN|nr:cytochrome b [Cyanomargarita calcarea GSE-NOS-MK-12-04C]